jgi:thioredoxin-like negative regulator of GroEL
MTAISNEAAFAKAIQSHRQVLVCFHSTRSAYSRRTLQCLRALEPDFPNLNIQLVDVDQIQFEPLMRRLVVVAVPTLMVLRDGQCIGLLVGERSQKVFGSLLNSILNPKTQSQ